jgi:hypothetical protein
MPEPASTYIYLWHRKLEVSSYCTRSISQSNQSSILAGHDYSHAQEEKEARTTGIKQNLKTLKSAAMTICIKVMPVFVRAIPSNVEL